MKKFWIIPGVLAALGVAVVLGLHHWKWGPFAAAIPVAEAKAQENPTLEEDPPAAGHVQLTSEQIKNSQIQAEPIVAKSFAPQIHLLGTIQEDPDAAFVVRAPAAGTVREGSASWPKLGQTLGESRVIGTLEPRLVPSDQIALASQRAALQTQVAGAQAEVTSASAALEIARVSYQRLKTLNTQDKNVSDRVVEDAQAKVLAEEARLGGARQALELGTKAIQGLDIQLSAIPLTIPNAGQVMEVTVHPGEAVEPGQQIVRVRNPARLIVALNFPSNSPPFVEMRQAHVLLPGRNDALSVDIVAGASSSVDPRTREQIVPFHLAIPAIVAPPAPGTPVNANIDLPGQPLQGFVLPRSTVVRFQGKAWVYIKAREGSSFNRIEVSLDHPLPDGSGWFVNEGLKGDEQVVTAGASVLLSHELIVLGG